MNRKAKLLKELQKELDVSHKGLLKLFQIVEQRDTIVFRMPATFFTLEELWEQVVKIANKLNIKVIRTDLYATVQELDNILTNIEWLWKGNIPKGFMTLVAGEPGVGKSLFVLDIAKIITRGLEFPMSGQTAEQGSVLWVDTEMKQQLLNVRSKSLEVDRSRLYIPSIGGNLLMKFDASIPEHTEHILAIIEEKKPSLVVVDSLGHSHSKGENRIEEVRPVMDFLTSIARDYNTSVIVVHHLNKGAREEATEVSLARVRGSTDIVATPVVIFAIERSAEESVKIRQIKNNIGKPQPALSAILQYHDEEKEEIKSLEYKLYSPPPPKRTKKELVAEWVEGILVESKSGVPLSKLIEMGEGYGYTRGNIYSARDVLGDKLTFTGTGKLSIWHLTKSENDEEAIKQIQNNGKKRKK